MKTLNITFEDNEVELLERVKKNKKSKSWRKLIVEMANETDKTTNSN